MGWLSSKGVLSNPGVETTRNKKSEGLKFQNSWWGFPHRWNNHRGLEGVVGSSKGRSALRLLVQNVTPVTFLSSSQSGFKQPEVPGAGQGLGPAADAQFAVEVPNVGFYGRRRDLHF